MAGYMRNRGGKPDSQTLGMGRETVTFLKEFYSGLNTIIKSGDSLENTREATQTFNPKGPGR